MVNIRLVIEYDGEPYHGWQRQRESPTVQSEIEGALERILGRRTVLYGAGPRTLAEANGHAADECLRLNDLRRATATVACAIAEILA